MSSSRDIVERTFREESGRILATLIRFLGDFDLAEEAMQDAFAVALERWVEDVPEQPAAWISTVARRKAIDRLRKSRASTLLPDDAVAEERQIERLESRMDCSLRDDRLRLIFTCCHPALNREAQIALTLRTLGGLTTVEVAHAFLVPSATLAQRLVRAKQKIKEARIPYRVPPDHLLPERLASVLLVLYLIFNEGYAASGGDDLIRRELCAEAVRLARALASLMPDEPEALGLLALFLLQDARREARIDSSGNLVLLEDQDRSTWNRRLIREGIAILEGALARGRPGTYQVQAAIAAVHAEAETSDATDWEQIVGLYDTLLEIHPGPVVALNRAAAVAMWKGPEAGLEIVETLAGDGALDDYLYLHSTRARLLEKLDRREEARAAYRRALELASNEAERRFLEKKK